MFQVFWTVGSRVMKVYKKSVALDGRVVCRLFARNHRRYSFLQLDIDERTNEWRG